MHHFAVGFSGLHRPNAMVLARPKGWAGQGTVVAHCEKSLCRCGPHCALGARFQSEIFADAQSASLQSWRALAKKSKKGPIK